MGARRERLIGAVLPVVGTLREYRLPWLTRDLLAGLSVSALLVPAGMAYAQAAGLPPINGIYATMLPLVAYAVVGPSRVLILGPDSALVAVIATTVLPLAHGDVARSVELAAILALITGAICVLASAVRLGFVAELLSKPVRYGYLHGIAVTVALGQVPALLGFSVGGEGFVATLGATIAGIAGGRVNGAAAIIGSASLVVVIGLRVVAPRAPGVLLVVVGASVCVGLGLAGSVPVVGGLPRGLPRPVLPGVGWGDASVLATAALATALVAFTDTAVFSRALAAREGRDLEPNRELFALGAVNLATGLFQGFPVSSSSSRTPVAISSGARTRLAGVFAAVVVAIVLVALPWIFSWLPTCALAAVVISAVLTLVEPRAVARIRRHATSEFTLFAVSFLAVLLLGVVPGIGVAVGVSLLDVVRHSWRPHFAVLGRVPRMRGYHDVSRHRDAHLVPGLVLLRWDAPLFFANTDYFRDRVRDLVRDSRPAARWVVIAAEPVTDVDTTAADGLSALLDELGAQGVTLAFAEMKGPVKDTLRKYGLFDRVGAEHFFPTVGEAVRRYLAATGVVWADPAETGEAPSEQPSPGRGGSKGSNHPAA